MPRELNAKQKAFAREYVVDSNATQAAIRAGYKKRSAYAQGHALLKKPEVKALIGEHIAKLEEKAEASAEWILKRLKEEATLGEDTTPQSRVGSLDKLAKIRGMYREDNEQKATVINLNREDQAL